MPFKDTGHLTAAQKNYNFRQSSARVVVEKCFALLKGRMRSLMYCLHMFRIDLVAEYVVACCVIHNICILREDELVVIPVLAAADNLNKTCHVNERQLNVNGVCKRNIIMNTMQRRDICNL